VAYLKNIYDMSSINNADSVQYFLEEQDELFIAHFVWKVSSRAKRNKLDFKNVQLEFSIINFNVIEQNPLHRNCKWFMILIRCNETASFKNISSY
jgi:hypothetical protein